MIKNKNIYTELKILFALSITLMVLSMTHTVAITKQDEIVKETKNLIYVKTYELGNKNSKIITYNKPKIIYAKCVDKDAFTEKLIFKTLKSNRTITTNNTHKEFNNFETKYKNKVFKLKYTYYPNKGYYITN